MIYKIRKIEILNEEILNSTIFYIKCCNLQSKHHVEFHKLLYMVFHVEILNPREGIHCFLWVILHEIFLLSNVISSFIYNKQNLMKTLQAAKNNVDNNVDNPLLLVAWLSSQFECLPKGDFIPRVSRCGPSSSPPGRQSPGNRLPPARPHSFVKCPSTAAPHLRVRSSSRPTSYLSLILGFVLQELRFSWLIPHNNPTQILKLQI